MVAKWLRIDEHRDVLSSTDMLALVAPTLQKNPHAWKWMILQLITECKAPSFAPFKTLVVRTF